MVALIASVIGKSESHDGRTAFSLELRLSGVPKSGFGYGTLRNHVLTVTVCVVTKTPRLERGVNLRWEIHVEPDFAGDVTVIQPVTAYCDAEGAICTGDGRQLENRSALVVSGPEG